MRKRGSVVTNRAGEEGALCRPVEKVTFRQRLDLEGKNFAGYIRGEHSRQREHTSVFCVPGMLY